MSEQIKFLEAVLRNVNISLNLLSANNETLDADKMANITNLLNENKYKILDSYEYFYRLKKGIELTLNIKENKINTNEETGK